VTELNDETIDQLSLELLNTVLTLEERQLSETEVARLRLALADPSPEIEELISDIRTDLADVLAGYVVAIFNAAAIDPLTP
jgi:hypothetical protein